MASRKPSLAEVDALIAKLKAGDEIYRRLDPVAHNPKELTAIKEGSGDGGSLIGDVGHGAWKGLKFVGMPILDNLARLGSGVMEATARVHEDEIKRAHDDNSSNLNPLEKTKNDFLAIPEALKGFGHGFIHHDTTGSDVIQRTADANKAAEEQKGSGKPLEIKPGSAHVNPVVKYGGGFIGDIVADPLTYAGGIGIVNRVRRGGKTVDEVVQAEKAAGNIAKTTEKTAKQVPLQIATHTAPLDTSIVSIQPVSTVLKETHNPVDTLLSKLEQKSGTNLATGTELGNAADNAVEELPKLPANLAGAKSRFNIGSTVYHPEFDNDVAKALYVVAGKGASKNHREYLQFLRNHFTDLNDNQIIELGGKVKNAIKESVAGQPGGRVPVETRHLFSKEALTPAGKAAVAIDAAATSEKAATVAAETGDVAKAVEEAAVAPVAKTAKDVLEEVAAKNPRKVKQYKSPHIKARAGKEGSTNPADYMITTEKKNELATVIEREMKAATSSVGKNAQAIVASSLRNDKEVLNKAKAYFEAAKKAKSPETDGLVWSDVKNDKVLSKYFIDKVAKSAGKAVEPVAAFDKQARFTELKNALVKNELAKEARSANAAKKAAAETATKKIAQKEAEKAIDGAPTVLKDTDKAIAERVAREYANKGYKTYPKRNYPFNLAKQQNLWNEVREEVLKPRGGFNKVGKSRSINRQVIAAYSHAIDTLTSVVGHAPVGLQGQAFRLDHVLEALSDIIPPNALLDTKFITRMGDALAKGEKGIKAFADELNVPVNDLSAAVNAANKVSAVNDAEKVAGVVTDAENTVKNAVENLDEISQAKVRESLPGAAADQAAATGAAQATVDSVKETVQEIVKDIPANPVYTTAARGDIRTVMVNAYAYGKTTTEVVLDLKKVSDASIRELGFVRLGFGRNPTYLFTTTRGVATLDKIAAATPESLSKLFRTSYGMASIHNEVRAKAASAEAFAESRIAELQKTLSHPELNTVEKQIDAFKNMAPDLIDGHAGAQVLRDHISRYVAGKESLMAHSGMTVDELNPFLKAQFGGGDFFQFEKEFKVLGKTVKATSDNMVDQIATWNPTKLTMSKNPVGEMLYNLETAVEKASAHNLAMSHLASALGTTEKVRGFAQVNHPRLKGIWFPPEIVPQIEKQLSLLQKAAFGDKSELEKVMGPVLEWYDAGLRAWKKGVTQYSPAHHSRNMMGDIWLSYLMGVNNPKRYKEAMDVIRSRELIRDSEQFYELGRPLENVKSVTEKTIIRAHPKLGNVSADQIYHAFTRYGGPQATSFTEEFSKGANTTRSITRPFKGRVDTKVRELSEAREDTARIAQFIHELRNTKHSNLDDAAREAMTVVRKTHFDYGDLTDFERKFMKRLVPFYTWTRKSVPFMLEQFMQKPYKMAVIPKLNYAIAGMMGQDPQSFSMPWPQSSDALFPNWMKASMGAQWFHIGDNPVMGKVADPFNDSLSQNLGESPVAQLSPFLKVPAELSFDKQAIGIPINDKSRYIDAQIPFDNVISRLTNTSFAAGGLESLVSNPKPGTGFKRTTDPNSPGNSGFANIAAILSQLTGLGFNEATKSRQKSAEFERKNPGR